MLDLLLEIDAFLAGGGPPHEGGIGEGGPGEGFDEFFVGGGGGVVEGLLRVFNGKEGRLIVFGVVAGLFAEAVWGGPAASDAASAEFLLEGSVPAEVALAGFHYGSLRGLDVWPYFLFGLFAI